ncbi:MAG: acyltransferase family protein [Deltaproteobacteria bacterium]|nr:MAG: acyltransferase family protein [Deltaproteobacteria bacterium]
MEKEADNVHYLKPNLKDSKKSQADSFQDLISKKTSEKISQDLSHQLSSQLSSMVARLEDRIHHISKEVSMTGSEPSLFDHSQKFIVKSLKSLRKLISTNEIKTALKDLWFGNRGLTDEFDEFGMDPHFKERIKPLFDFLYYDYWRVSVKGLHNIPNEGAGLIVPNHSGTFPYDGAMIAEGIVNDHPSRKDVRFLVEDFVYHFPFMGTFMYRIGGVRACPENCERLLSKNHLVTVFPEGVKGIGKAYKNRYRLQRFGRGGFIKLALRTKSPVIPTAVIGAEEIHPLLHRSTLLARPLGVPYIPITPTFPLLGPLGLVPFLPNGQSCLESLSTFHLNTVLSMPMTNSWSIASLKWSEKKFRT